MNCNIISIPNDFDCPAHSIVADSALELPLPLPNSDPERAATLFQLLDQLSQTLITTLYLPPKNAPHLPSVPVEKIMGVIFRGHNEPPPTGNTVGDRVVTASLPILQAAMWNILSALIKTCHAHLWPCAQFIRMSLVNGVYVADK